MKFGFGIESDCTLAKRLSDRSETLLKRKQWSAIPILAAVIIVFFAQFPLVHDCHAEEPEATSKPPIVMIVLDDLFDYRQFRNRFGVQLKTPNFDRLAARGTTFGNAFCSIAVCNASRSSVFSGISPLKTGIHQPEPLQFFDKLATTETLNHRMMQAGYHVAGTGKVMHTSARSSDRAFMEQIHDEFYQASGRLLLPSGRIALAQEEGVLSADDKHVAWAADKLRNWEDGGDPLFMSVGIIRPHRPFIVPQEFFDLYDRSSIRVPGQIVTQVEMDLLDVSVFYQMYRLLRNYVRYLVRNDFEEEFIHGYLASTSYADAKVGEILDAIDSNPALADARIILFSDNGYELGDKYTWNKFTLWETSAKVPMIVVDPSLPIGREIAHSVSLLDVAPTVLDWANEPIPDTFDGLSLLTTAANRNEPDHRSVLTTMMGSMSVRRGNMRINLYPDGSVELFDMSVDVLQRNDISHLPQWQDEVVSLKQDLVAEVQRLGGCIDPDSPVVQGTPEDDVVFLIGDQAGSGGGGNDTYFVADGTIIESADGGNDTVYFANNQFTLPRNVETASTYPMLNTEGAPVWNVTGNNEATTILIFGAQGEVHAGGGSDLIFSVGARDRLDGGNGRDEIHAGGNDDYLQGGPSGDQLFGDAGNDELDGGPGPDILSGGSGSDRFRFPSADTSRDIVTDFEFGLDKIVLHPNTMLYDLTAEEIADRLISLGSGVLIRDDSGKRMLIENATPQEVLASFEKDTTGEPDDIGEPDTGEPVDTGEPSDGEPDTGEPTDTGEPGDAGEPDSGEPVDTGEPGDGGEPDTGEPTDTGEPSDGGEPDTGEPVDNGEPSDAGEPDTGEPTDTGEPSDGGEPDTGEPADNGEPSDPGEPDTGEPTDTGEPSDGEPDSDEPVDNGEPDDAGEPDTGEPVDTVEPGDGDELDATGE